MQPAGVVGLLTEPERTDQQPGRGDLGVVAHFVEVGIEVLVFAIIVIDAVEVSNAGVLVLRAAMRRVGSARIGAAGRDRVITRWSWRNTAERTVEHYRALLAES